MMLLHCHTIASTLQLQCYSIVTPLLIYCRAAMEWQWSSIEIMHLHSIEITIIRYYTLLPLLRP